MNPIPLENSNASAVDGMSSATTTPQNNGKSPDEIFNPVDRQNTASSINLPEELWMTILESACHFDSDIFVSVMLNLIKNPNITSTYLFRADIFYDSESSPGSCNKDDVIKHLKPEYRPLSYSLPGLELSRTIVRQLIPRNPQLDAPLLQTCHFYQGRDAHRERSVVIYIPHVKCLEDVPFYHPSVARLAFEHTFRTTLKDSCSEDGSSSISVSYSLFQGQSLTTKLERTALRLLQTVHKHGQGQVGGYEKRVHLDQIIPQKRYQDTYTRLKAKYGKQLSEQWVEVTDPGKHVFEDIGIAAFLIELWRDLYRHAEDQEARQGDGRPVFPGFVDIGCGNGVLVHILLQEGYEGEGFDARERKTWNIFPPNVRQRLKRRILIPDIFSQDCEGNGEALQDNGIFAQGTFIISNHADELTAWTPLLAYLNESSFIAIPCCSHDLSGARFRAPPSTRSKKTAAARLPQQQQQSTTTDSDVNGCAVHSKQAAETGSLRRTEAQKKMPSAYSSLCSYVASLTEDMGFVAETDVLRIPSTRNHCIIGRRRQSACQDVIEGAGREQKRQRVVEVVERELGRSVDQVGADWLARAEKLAKKPGSGH